jgi:cytochrome P450
MAQHPRPPAPSALPFTFKSLWARRNIAPVFMDLFREHGEVVWLRNSRGPGVYLISNPTLIKQFLADNALNNYQRNPTPGPRSIVMGASLSNLEGPSWMRHRRMLQPAFLRERLLAQVPRMAEVMQGVLDTRWEPHARGGEPMEMFPAAARLVVSTLGQLVCSEVPPDDVCDAMFRYMHFAIEPIPLMLQLGLLPPWLMGHHLQFFHPEAMPAGRKVNAYAWEMVRKRLTWSEQPDDILGMLINARDASGERMTEQELRDELVELVFGGQVGTSSGMAWMWHELSREPEVAGRLADEVERALGGRLPEAGDLGSLQYVSQVFEESLRLHPPSPGINRVAVQEDTLGGYHVPVGTEVVASAYIMHRHPEYWRDPEVFDPSRFAPEQVQARPRFVYIPFGAGQRVCIGAMLATHIAIMSTSLVAQRYRLESVPGRKMVPLTGSTHFPGRFWLKVSPARRRLPATQPRVAAG